jgi:hypothetical protein
MKHKKTYINKVGRIGRRNIEANKKIAEMWENMGINSCEAMIDENCTRNYGLTNCHRHTRIYYYSQPELLYDYTQVIRACLACHIFMEGKKQLTETIFEVLRGKEKVGETNTN